MRLRADRWLAGFVLVALASVSWAAVTVQFVDPQRFVDGTMEGYREPPEANRVLVEIRRHLLALGARCIPAEQSLTIRVLELDLGGHYEWQQRASTGNVRVLRDVVWSRMTIEYLWQGGDGTVLGRSVDRLEQAIFLGSDIRRSTADAVLPDEKAMMTEWLEARFCKDGKASSPPDRRP
jgi:hypothetical protein